MTPNGRLIASTHPRPAPATWQADIDMRMRRWLWLKVIGTTAVTWLFFIAYFHLLREPAYASWVMPLSALDENLPFQPPLIVAYFSLWVYIGIAPGLQLQLAELLAYGFWAGALCLSGLTLFYFFPTEVPAVIQQGHSSSFPGFGLLRGIDAAGNACPSMHVAAAVFTMMGIHEVLRRVRAPKALCFVNWTWCLVIVYSTLAVKQHVLLDAWAGALLGATFGWAALRWQPRTSL